MPSILTDRLITRKKQYQNRGLPEATRRKQYGQARHQRRRSAPVDFHDKGSYHEAPAVVSCPSSRCRVPPTPPARNWARTLPGATGSALGFRGTVLLNRSPIRLEGMKCMYDASSFTPKAEHDGQHPSLGYQLSVDGILYAHRSSGSSFRGLIAAAQASSLCCIDSRIVQAVA